MFNEGTAEMPVASEGPHCSLNGTAMGRKEPAGVCIGHSFMIGERLELERKDVDEVFVVIPPVSIDAADILTAGTDYRSSVLDKRIHCIYFILESVRIIRNGEEFIPVLAEQAFKKSDGTF